MPDYDAWLLWNLGAPCNLSCAYCFAIMNGDSRQINGAPAAVDIPALLKTLDGTKKTFRIHFSGYYGEPFLVPNILEACEELTHRHYLTFNTHLASDKVKAFARKTDPRRVPSIVASLHLKELERRGWSEKYAENFALCREKGFNISSIAVAYPELAGEAERYKEYYARLGIEFSFLPFLGDYAGKRYPLAYTEEEFRRFGLQRPEVDKYLQKGNLCNAGYNAAVVHPNGEVRPCATRPEVLGTIYGGFQFKASLAACPYENCGCPLREFDKGLFQSALERIS